MLPFGTSRPPVEVPVSTEC